MWNGGSDGGGGGGGVRVCQGERASPSSTAAAVSEVQLLSSLAVPRSSATSPALQPGAPGCPDATAGDVFKKGPRPRCVPSSPPTASHLPGCEPPHGA